MTKVYFSASAGETFAVETPEGHIIDPVDVGYTVSTEGIDLGNVAAKTAYIDIEGADGRIDVTNALTDDVHYNNREVTVPLQSIAMHSTDRLVDRFALDQLFSGKVRKMFIDDWYLEGRFSIESSFSVPVRKYTIKGDCKPYRFNAEQTVVEYIVTNTLECAIDYDDRMPVCPVINVSADMQMTLYGSVYSLKKGDNIVPDLILRYGTNTFSLSGAGMAVFTWRGGNL